MMKRWLARQTSLLAWTPYVVLLTSLLLTLVAGVYVALAGQTAERLRFENLVQQNQDAIAARVETYISLLRGTAGLLAASDSLDRDEFHAYVDRLKLAEHNPGIQGVGFSLRVLPSDVPAVVERMRRQGLPEFHIWPEGPRPEYHTVIYLEPQDRRNQAAIGYDMFSEPVRRAAMEQARDTGFSAASGRVTLVQEIDPHKQAGFLIYVPVYRGGGVPATVDERRAALVGFAYSPFRAGDLLSGIFGSQREPRISFELYDGADPTPANLLYSSNHVDDSAVYRPTFTTTTTMTVAGREWTLIYATRPAFDTSSARYVVPFVFLTGVLVSIALFAVTRAQVVARAQAEEAVRVRDVFLSVASHELKTPLTTLLGNTQLLRRRVARDGGLVDRDRRALDVIVDQTDRLNRLINALLDHSRLQTGRLSIERTSMSLGLLLRQVLDEIRPTLAEHTLVFEEPGEPLTIDGDALRLEQVFQNLVGNAVKYSPRGGPVVVDLERRDDWAIVRVADRGIGIPAGAIPHLFQQFYRAPNTAEQHIRGLGIGLYLAREIIHQHGGDIAVESVEGAGSTFIVRLPLAVVVPHPPQPHVDMQHVK
jgi:signal transduction histidine kinase